MLDTERKFTHRVSEDAGPAERRRMGVGMRRRGHGIDWSAQPLGRRPDSEIAAALMVTPQAVSHARRARAIPPYTRQARVERAQQVDQALIDFAVRLEAAAQQVLDPERVGLTVQVADQVRQVPGWRSEAEVRLGDGGQRLLAFRVSPPRRPFTRWANPSEARQLLVEAGWVDAALSHATALRQGRAQVRR
jgi:hypothetical protein